MHEQRQALIVVLNLYKKGSMPRTNAVTLIEALFSQKDNSSSVMGLLNYRNLNPETLQALEDVDDGVGVEHAKTIAEMKSKLASEAEDA